MTPTSPSKSRVPAATDGSATPRVSVVVPCHNEEGNIRQLLVEIRETIEPTATSYEVLLVDDASADGTWAVLEMLGAMDARVRGIRFAAQCGQSAAMWAGIKCARGDVIVTLDADLQNPPSEIPRLLAALDSSDCVCGSRVAARIKGDNWIRRASSKIANSVRAAFTKDGMSDSGCCYRAFRRECVKNLHFFKGAHRFLPALLLMEGFRVTEIAISHRPRGMGQSHYGIWNRLAKSLPDLLAVRWMKERLIDYQIVATVNSTSENDHEQPCHARSDFRG
jgi:glycosyltransferase involved in cell wall biosynthesis